MNWFCGCLFLLLGSSCSKFLDVKPEDAFLDEQVYSSKSNIQQVLNGFYMQMTESNSYGGNLTMTFMDVLGQYYNMNSVTSPYYSARVYDYTTSPVQQVLEGIWTSSFNTIKDINVFMANVKQVKPTVLSDTDKNIYLGEAIGLRAFLEFDLLRGFGPVYSLAADEKSIPYSLRSTAQVDSLLKASEVIELVLLDLDSAINYLAQDPIIGSGVVKLDEQIGTSTDNFMRLRNRRFNYYAAKALRARVLLYAGRNQEAYDDATEVIQVAGKWFPFTPANRVLPSLQNPDRTFSSEVIFGLDNRNLYSTHRSNFDASLIGSLGTNNGLIPLNARVNGWFASAEDLRGGIQWVLDASAASTIRTFYKFNDDQASRDSAYYYFQPLMRISEMYYIAAETAPNLQESADYLNEIRFHKGYEGTLTLNNEAELKTNLEAEYRREFSGEGQMFFYYKRLYQNSIPNGSNANQNLNVNQPGYFIFPLPLNETNYR